MRVIEFGRQFRVYEEAPGVRPSEVVGKWWGGNLIFSRPRAPPVWRLFFTCLRSALVCHGAGVGFS